MRAQTVHGTHPSDPYVGRLRAPETTPKAAARVYRLALREILHGHDLVPVHAAILDRWGPEEFDRITWPVLRRLGLAGELRGCREETWASMMVRVRTVRRTRNAGV